VKVTCESHNCRSKVTQERSRDEGQMRGICSQLHKVDEKEGIAVVREEIDNRKRHVCRRQKTAVKGTPHSCTQVI
jgi:hypothetical protein